MRFAFDVCVKDTTLDGAELEIAEPAGTELRLTEVEVL
jgi:Zn finger protein HypA/HybF involved in hydrogenase expression